MQQMNIIMTPSGDCAIRHKDMAGPRMASIRGNVGLDKLQWIFAVGGCL
jgi:hypothetical protein